MSTNPQDPNNEPFDDDFENGFFDPIDLNSLGAEDDAADLAVEDMPDVHPEPSMSVDELLQQLVHEPELPSFADLCALSDLSRRDEEAVRTHWALIPVERRRQIVADLAAAMDQYIDLQLGRFLRVALSDEDSKVRKSAIEALAEDAESDLVGPLVQILHNDAEAEVRAAAAAALGGYVLLGELEEMDSAYSMRAEEALLNVMAEEAETMIVRQRALESIAYSGEAGVRQLIEDAYYSPYEDMRVSALTAMGRSADIRWRGLARAELQNPSAEMRIEAAWACGELEAKDAVSDLIALLDDEELNVRLVSIFALGRIGGRDANDALQAMSLSEDPREAEAAELALEELLFYGQADAVALFDESLEEDDWDPDPWDTRYDKDDRDLGEYG